MNALSVVLSIAVASIVAPLVTRLHKRPLVWVTLAVVNLIIISLYIIIRDTWHPELRAAEN
jgi:hypothetical protein